jgi:pyruvate/2-oxoglutarate/acetoin dehydrogenase E1 component
MSERMLTMAEALREALGIAMTERPEVFILGEDIGIYGGAFGVTGDLYQRFGPERVLDTPISELGIVGAAVGAALSGMRPIVEIQFSDFTAQAMDQIKLRRFTSCWEAHSMCRWCFVRHRDPELARLLNTRRT